MAIKIMIDPGHYCGYNKATNGYAEGTRMWDYSRLLIPKLQAYGFTVACTRSNTYDYPGRPGDDNITFRGRMASGYDLMLSLHTNACDSTSVKRPVVIYPVSGKCKDLANNLSKNLHIMLGNTDSPNYQIFSKYNSAGNADYYGVIRGAASVGVPCLIIEHMFHTNPSCAAWMMSDSNLNKMAQVVADTVAAYYGVKTNAQQTNTQQPSTTVSTTKVNYQAVTTTDLNCRKGASTSYSIIKTYATGTRLTITQEYNGWGYTGEGWVYLAYVSKVQSTQTSTQTPTQTAFKSYLVKITASVLNVRSGPSTGYKINTTVTKGGVYTIVEEKNGWGKLKSGAGWISLAYTTKC